MQFQDTGYTIKQVQQQIHTVMEDALRPLSLNISQYNVLKNLETSPFLIGAELARKAFVTPQTMHTILTTMERKNFVIRTAITGNNKSFSISITESGVATLKIAERSLDNVYAQANSALSTQEHAELNRLLNKLSTGLEPQPNDYN